MTGSDGADLLPALRFIAPDDGNPDDRTVAEVILPRPGRSPARRSRVAIDFRLAPAARLGAAPATRTTSSWSCSGSRRSASSRRTAGTATSSTRRASSSRTSATTTSRSTSPRATRARSAPPGSRSTSARPRPDRVLYRFRQAERPRLRVDRRPELPRARGTPSARPGLGDVEHPALLQPEHASQAERHFRAAQGRALGLRARPRRVSLRHPDDRGSALGRARRRAAWSIRRSSPAARPGARPPSIHRPEGVTVHEFGPPVLLRTARLQRVRGGLARRGLQHVHDRPGPQGDLRAQPRGPRRLRPPLPARHRHPLPRRRQPALLRGRRLATSSPRRAGSSATGRSYGSQIYSKTALALATLERLLGTPAMDRALRLYADRWRFRHPTTRDFIAAVNDSTGRGLELVLRPDVLLLGRSWTTPSREAESKPAEAAARPLREGRQARAEARRRALAKAAGLRQRRAR